MSRFDGRIAVFICGPIRYVSQVTMSLRRQLDGFEYDFFYHLWKDDLGNKRREQEETDVSGLLADNRTRLLIQQEPYSVEDFRSRIGTNTESGSTINATMGMFFSVNALCHYLSLMPDAGKYRYILRFRTDCAMLVNDLIDRLDPSPGVLTVSKNCHVPEGRISDHIAFGAKETFVRLWQFKSMNDIYDLYEAGGRNPEAALGVRFSRQGADMRLNLSLERFVDYHIIRFPPRDTEPKWITRALNDLGLAGFFAHGGTYFDATETAAYIARQNKRSWAYYDVLEASRKRGTIDVFGALRGSEIAAALMCVYEEHPHWARPLWEEIRPSLSITIIGQMLQECVHARQEYPAGTAWLSEALSAPALAGRLFVAGCQKLQMGLYGEAVAFFQEALEKGHPLPNIYFAMATAYARMGRLGSARHACQQQLKLSPDHRPTVVLMARLDESMAADTASSTVTQTNKVQANLV